MNMGKGREWEGANNRGVRTFWFCSPVDGTEARTAALQHVEACGWMHVHVCDDTSAAPTNMRTARSSDTPGNEGGQRAHQFQFIWHGLNIEKSTAHHHQQLQELAA